jgi:L-alanine-DL-glutamate epimerase-like enolase superfamily enzyme
VAVNALLGIGDPATVAEEARRLAEAGFGCLKLKGGEEEPGVLVRRVAAVRESVGPLVGLRLDLNGSLEEASAVGLLEQLAPFRLDYVEQPVPVAAGVDGLARLRRRASVPIAADEAVTDQVAAEALMRGNAVDVLVVKPARVGGPDEASRIVDAALSAGVRVTVATLLESGVGVAAALHLAATVPGDAAHGLSTATWLASDLLARRLVIRGGRLSVPQVPGLGIVVDPGLVARYRVTGDAWHV